MADIAHVPHHIAIVMDGNGRWATRRFLPRVAGHHQGVESLRRCVKACLARGVGVLSVFAFSSENWNRPVEEVSGLMEVVGIALTREVAWMKKDGIRIYIVGDRRGLSDRMCARLDEAEQSTAHNTRMVLNVCFNYGGRWDIARALALAHVPDPDLLIRTGGELRISNFMLWQLAYAELHFSSKLWPEFDEAALDEAIAAYSSRERRFGKTSAQVTSAPAASHTKPRT